MKAPARQSPSGFALRFALCIVGVTAVYAQLEPFIGYVYLYPISLTAATLLKAVGVPTALYLYLDQGFCALQMQRHLFHVEYECTGVFSLCIYLATVGVYPTTWTARLWGFVVGVPAFFAYSALRLLGLGVVGHLVPAWIDFFHIYLMVLLNLGFLLFLWAFWVKHWTAEGTAQA